MRRSACRQCRTRAAGPQEHEHRRRVWSAEARPANRRPPVAVGSQEHCLLARRRRVIRTTTEQRRRLLCSRADAHSARAGRDWCSGLLRPAAAVRWPAGFGDRLPDDASLLEPSKCAVRLLSTHSLDPRAEFSFEIQIANSFGDAPVGTQRLVLVLASAVSVLSEETIFISPNQTVVTISRLAPSTVGAYNVSVQDTSAGYRQELNGSPFQLVVRAAPSCKAVITELVSTRIPFNSHLMRSRETLIGSLVIGAMANFLQSRFVARGPRPRA